AVNRGYNVLIFDGVLDSHYINTLEQKFEKTKFTRVDGDVIDKLIQKEENNLSGLTDDQKEQLKPLFEEVVDKTSYQIQFENMSSGDQPVLITQSEFMRRYKEMNALGGGMSWMGNMPDSYNLVVNTNHPLITRLATEPEEANRKQVARQLADLALLSQGLLKGPALTDFIKRSIDMID
nr:molecular chaperone HtpG [Bacteroidales bacterium]